MADYKTMYFKLFNEMNATIERLKVKLLETEEIYIKTDTENSFYFLTSRKKQDDK